MVMTTIPSFFVIQAASGGPYLSLNNTEKDPPGPLEFSEPNIFSPRVKFAVEKKSKSDDPTLVNIRSCFNNKYWVPVPHQEAGKGFFKIAASADKRQEDTEKPACTLFRVSSTHSKGTPGFQFFGNFLYAMRNALGEFILYETPDKIPETFLVVDWEKLVILPSQVSFKSEHLSSSYLHARVIDGYNHNSFESGLDIGDPKLGYELIPASDGNYRIKSLSYGKLLTKINPEWIGAHAKDTNTSDDTLFSFTKISDNVFALSYVANQKFCGPAGANNCLSASYSGLYKETRLIVEERVLKKKISNVRYREPFIHSEQVEVVQNQFVTNEGQNEAKTTLEFSKTESFTTSWNNSESLSIGISYSVGFEVDAAPFVFHSQIETSTGISFSREWGRSKTKETESKASYEVTVPPKATMKVSLMVVNGVCDVPFNYTESVLLPNGEWVTREKEDGIYKGIRSLDFYLNSKSVDFQPGLGIVIGNK